MSSRVTNRSSLGIGRVLLVEDEPLIAFELEEALLEGGTQSVVRCSSIAEALPHLDGEPLDAVILDVHLKDRDDGWALAELVKLLGPRTPEIVFATGSPQDIPPEIAEMGKVFAKPYDPEALVASLRKNNATIGTRLLNKLRNTR